MKVDKNEYKIHDNENYKKNKVNVNRKKFDPKINKKYLNTFRVFLTTFSLIAFTLSFFYETVYEDGEVPYFLYFTHLSNMMVVLYFAAFTTFFFTKNARALKIMGNFYLKGFVTINILATGVIYMVFLFGPLLYGYFAIDTFNPYNFAIWLVMSLCLHFFVPVFC